MELIKTLLVSTLKLRALGVLDSSNEKELQLYVPFICFFKINFQYSCQQRRHSHVDSHSCLIQLQKLTSTVTEAKQMISSPSSFGNLHFSPFFCRLPANFLAVARKKVTSNASQLILGLKQFTCNQIRVETTKLRLAITTMGWVVWLQHLRVLAAHLAWFEWQR